MGLGNGDGRWRLVFSRKMGRRLRKLMNDAARIGIDRELVAELRLLSRRLPRDSVGFGDSIWTLKQSGLTVFHRSVSLIVVRYAVDEKRRLVILQSVTEMPGRWE